MRRRRRRARITNNKTSKTNSKLFKRLLVILMLILAFAVLILSLMFFVSGSRWDGKSKFSFAIPNENGDVSVVVVDPTSSTVLNILIPKNTQVIASNQLGTWKMGSIYSLDQHENLGGMLLKSTIFKTFYMPIDGWSEDSGLGLVSNNPITVIKSVFSGYATDISFKDKVKLAYYSLRTRTANRVDIDLAENSLDKEVLPDGEDGYIVTRELSPSVLAYFTDSTLAQKAIRIELINASGMGGISTKLARSIEALGARVMSIQTQAEKDMDCEIRGSDTVAVAKIANMFGCKIVYEETENNFDLQFKFGTEFSGRY